MAKPGAWHGTIKVSKSIYESTSYSWHEERSQGSGSHEILGQISDTFYLGGDDAAPGTGMVMSDLKARQYTQGVGSISDHESGTGQTMSGCTYAKVVAREWGGGWSFEADGDMFLMIQPDGQFTISFEAAHAPEPVEWPGGMTTTTTPAGEHSEGCEGYGTDTVDGPIPTLWDVTTPPDLSILTGQLDPANPGTTVSGTTTLDDPLNSSTTTVEWKLTHDGPISLGLP